MKDTPAVPSAVLAMADDVIQGFAGDGELDGGAETVAAVCSLAVVGVGHWGGWVGCVRGF